MKYAHKDGSEQSTCSDWMLGLAPRTGEIFVTATHPGGVLLSIDIDGVLSLERELLRCSSLRALVTLMSDTRDSPGEKTSEARVR